jgi:hypothetical protein
LTAPPHHGLRLLRLELRRDERDRYGEPDRYDRAEHDPLFERVVADALASIASATADSRLPINGVR